MKKVLVCGATGFIGRNLVEYLARLPGYQVFAVWHLTPPFQIENVTWRQADLRVEGDVNQAVAGMDIVIQAAATTSGAQDIVTTPYIHITDNAVMNSLLLRSVFDHHVKHFLFTSCTVMYPSSMEALRESDLDPSEEFAGAYFGIGWTKLYTEKMCEFFSRLGRTKHTVIRHSNIYGPYDKYDLERSHVFGATVAKVMNSDDRIVVWGSGEEERDLLHIEDLVRFVEKAIEGQDAPLEIFNCGIGHAISVKSLCETMVRLSGKTLKIEFDTERPTIRTSLFLDCSKAAKLLGWRPSIELEEGARQTLAWYKKQQGSSGQIA